MNDSYTVRDFSDSLQNFNINLDLGVITELNYCEERQGDMALLYGVRHC